ncbi:MAG: Fungal specific transcription factor [Bogoriella megaspora]|nr:MAG: Fungal specific transcription factor [Bogoriella megaspora]
MSQIPTKAASHAGAKRSHDQAAGNDSGLGDEHSATPSSPEAPGTKASAFRNGILATSLLAIDADNARTDVTLRFLLVGFDGKREVPRSYVYYLEERVTKLEALLDDHGIACPPADDVALHGKPQQGKTARPVEDAQIDEQNGLNRLVTDVGMVPTQGTSDARYLGSASGISFARVVFAAIRFSVLGSSGIYNTSKGNGTSSSTTMRDSFFGLNSKPKIQQASFPERELASRLVDLYFNYANPQVPVLHRDVFMSQMKETLEKDAPARTPRELYMLNMVFAIGAAVILPHSKSDSSPVPEASKNRASPKTPRLAKKPKLPDQQAAPEEYHASAIVHLETILGATSTESRDQFGSGLEELQAILLLASFALLRPIAPGLWYIVGVALRLAVDLGLHHEEGVGIDESSAVDHPTETAAAHQSPTERRHQRPSPKLDPKEMGRRQWIRDMRRRLWWCTYSLERIVCVCTGRPFGISDQVITTELCSPVDDKYITPLGIQASPSLEPSYKVVAHHYIRLRLLQSEILGVLQNRLAQRARATGLTGVNAYMVDTTSAYLHSFDSFASWRADIERRLLEWRDSAPQQHQSGVQFNHLFLELNYWQACIMLFRPSVSGLPPPSDGETPIESHFEEDDDTDWVYLKNAEAGQRVLKLYRQLHRLHLTLDDVDFTILAATSVLDDLAEHCPPALPCREAFDRMSKATISHCMSTTGFRTSSYNEPEPDFSNQLRNPAPLDSQIDPNDSFFKQQQSWDDTKPNNWKRPSPHFDMDLRTLFSDQELQPMSRPTQRELFQQTLAQNSSMAQTGDLPMPTVKSEGYNPSTHSHHVPLQSQQELITPMQSLSNANLVNDSFPNGMACSTNYVPEQLNFLYDYNWDGDADWALPGAECLNLGFGMQLGLGEGGRDWSETGTLDLFDGIFFGGPGGANGAE